MTDGPVLDCERAPAKINLFLHVVGRRPDGYHLLETLFDFVDLYDSLTVRAAKRFGVTVAGPQVAHLSIEGDTLVTRAVTMLADAAAVPIPAVDVRVEKHIPVAAGLGGGSADAAAALRLFNRLLKLDWPMERLMPLATDLGADVPACLLSRPCLGRGAGEALTLVDREEWESVLLVKPMLALPTAHVFKRFRDGDLPFRPALRPGQEGGWQHEDIRATGNDLTAPASELAPQVASLIQLLSELLPQACVRLSGSGPTVMALLDDARPLHYALPIIEERLPDYWFRPVKFLKSGL